MERKVGPGETTPVQGETQQPSPRMPHERDESSGSQAADEPTGREIGELGRKDVERGVKDTTKQSELEKTYDRLSGRG
ncbi:hypothetical protein [Ramlibacter albus]|uniref:Uncharacterized protein n=1 Tax=Ramlibacter albus TaxID=2079448 RepID=A0A923M7R8_9BURK|nr:hypothetical protein [Ramlibacter albus]MBC5764117.1 hypothetical protein [Ramlibacter albus]